VNHLVEPKRIDLTSVIPGKAGTDMFEKIGELRLMICHEKRPFGAALGLLVHWLPCHSRHHRRSSDYGYRCEPGTPGFLTANRIEVRVRAQPFRAWPYGTYKAYNSYMIPVSEAREQLADLVNRVAYRRERITLGRRGKKIAAIVSAEDLDLLEALEDAADLRLIAEALADPANKRPPIPWSVLEAELAKRG